MSTVEERLAAAMRSLQKQQRRVCLGLIGSKPWYTQRHLNQLVEIVGCHVVIQSRACKVHTDGAADEDVISGDDEGAATQKQQQPNGLKRCDGGLRQTPIKVIDENH